MKEDSRLNHRINQVPKHVLNILLNIY